MRDTTIRYRSSIRRYYLYIGLCILIFTCDTDTYLTVSPSHTISNPSPSPVSLSLSLLCISPFLSFPSLPPSHSHKRASYDRVVLQLRVLSKLEIIHQGKVCYRIQVQARSGENNVKLCLFGCEADIVNGCP